MLLNFNYDADPDPPFQCKPDPDPDFLYDGDPDPHTVFKIRVHLFISSSFRSTLDPGRQLGVRVEHRRALHAVFLDTQREGTGETIH